MDNIQTAAQQSGHASEREQAAWIIAGFGVLLTIVFGFLWWSKSPTIQEKIVEKIVERPVVVEKTVPVSAVLTDEEQRQQAVGWLLKNSVDESRTHPLKGIGSIQVSVSTAELISKISNLSELQTKIELRLRSLGIPIDNKEGAATLYIHIDAMEAFNKASIIFATRVQVRRVGFVFQNKIPVVCSPATWNDGQFGVYGTNAIKENCYSMLEPSIDKFANEYLAANPKN